jgi:hypothetical protein
MTGYPGGYPPPPPQQPYPGYGGYPYQYGPPPVAPRNGLGITALVLGIVGLLSFWSVLGGVVFGVAAIIVGIVARGRVKRGEANNGGIAVAGIVLGAVAVVVSLASIAVWAGVFREVGGTDYLDCVSRAGSDQQALDRCIDQLTDRVDGQFSTTPSR